MADACVATNYYIDSSVTPELKEWYESTICKVVESAQKIETTIKEFDEERAEYNEKVIKIEDLPSEVNTQLGKLSYSFTPANPIEAMNTLAEKVGTESVPWKCSWGSGQLPVDPDIQKVYQIDDCMTDCMDCDYEDLWEEYDFLGKVMTLFDQFNQMKRYQDTYLEAANTDAGAALAEENPELFDETGAIKEGLDDAQQAEAEAALAARQEELAAATWSEEETGYGNMVFKEQCFLLAKIFDLVDYKDSTIDYGFIPQRLGRRYLKRLPYHSNSDSNTAWPDGNNACLQVSGDPYGFVNHLVQSPEQGAFFDMKTEQISSLQPMIRLFKVEDVDGEEFQREFNFDAYASAGDVEGLFKDKTKRGFGAGIKNFSFTYDGNNPFAAKKSIKAQLTIFATSFDELLKDRGGYHYSDLALKTGRMPGRADSDDSQACQDLKQIREDNLSKLNFRLKAVVGFARPSGDTSTIFPLSTATQKNEVLSAIDESSVTLNLTPTMHEFKIDEMGRVNFVCNYLAYVDDFFDQPQFNIFFNEQVAKRTFARKYEYETLGANCSADELGAWKEDLAKSGVVRRDKFKNMRSVMTKLFNRGKIRTIAMSFDDVLTYQAKGPFFEFEGGLQALLGASTVTDRDAMQAALSTANQSLSATETEGEDATSKATEIGENVSFFYVSDLMDIILENIDTRLRLFSNLDTWFAIQTHNKDNSGSKWSADISSDERQRQVKKHKEFHQQFKKFRLLLGPVEIVNPQNNGASRFVDFGSIPISTRYFIEWLTEKMLKTEQTTYNLSVFLNDFFNTLVRNFLNNDTCFTGFSTKQKTRLSSATLTSYKSSDQPLDEITQWVDLSRRKANISQMPRPVLNISGPSGIPVSDGGVQNEINYLIFFAGRVQPTELMNGSRAEDEARGIFHYLLGRPRGIVKTLSLSKTEAKYLKEVRFEQEGFDGLEQLREVYDATIDCYANVKTFPGTYIYVDPRGFAPNQITYDGGTLDLTKFGIGGYFMIIRSEHTFGPGQAETKLTAKWVSQLANEAEEEECKAKHGTDAGDGSTTKCPASQTNRAIAAQGT